MNNPNLGPDDKMLAMAVQTIRRDPNAFNGALKNFVDQAIGAGSPGTATQALGGGMRVLQGAIASSGQAVPAGVVQAVNNLQQQFDAVVPSTAASGPSAPVATPTSAPSAGSAPSSPDTSVSDAIVNLVQQFVQTVEQAIPQEE
jgi:hypothetical protein